MSSEEQAPEQTPGTSERPEPPTPESPIDEQPRAPTPSKRSLRVMAVVRWVLLAFVTALAGYTVWTHWGPKQEHAATEHARYYCPMHPQIRSPDPGECPICHMNLEPIPEERQTHSTTSAAPMASAAPAAPVPSVPEVVPITLSAEKQQAVGVVTTTVETATLGDRLRVPGVINAPETGLSQVRVRAAGFVERVAVRQTGERVRRGQALAYVYSPEIHRAQEEFIAATRWNGAASGESAAPGATADLVSAARRGLELLGLSAADIDEVSRTGRPIRAIPVRAPAGGFVTRFNAVLGSRADPETVLYEIADLSNVWVIASIHERDLGAIRVGAAASFFGAVGQAEPLSGRVDLIEPLLEESTRTSRVRLVLPNREGRLRPGQFGEVEFELPAAPGLFVPRDAIIRTGEHEYVYVATAVDRFEPRLVTTGIARKGRVQIMAGLSAGDRVVTRGSFMLDSESRLQASLAAVPAAASSSETRSGVPEGEQGPSCDAAFDRERFADKYTQCRACERQHAGMGGMGSGAKGALGDPKPHMLDSVADCKNAIPKPWR